MFSLPSSDSDESDRREREVEFYQEIYGKPSPLRKNFDPVWSDPVWDWAINSQTELKTCKVEVDRLRAELAEKKGVCNYLSDSDVQLEIQLRLSTIQNEALKKRLKWHQLMTGVATIVLVFVLMSWNFKCPA